MEDKTTTYYTLRFEQTDATHRRGETVVVSSGQLRIGQQQDCKVLFANNSDFEDEQYAVVRPTQIPGEWQLIPTSEFVATYVNGTPVKLVHYLADGDRITFDGERQELLFSTHTDAKFDASQPIQVVAPALSRKLLAALVAVPLVLFAALAVFIIRDKASASATDRMLLSLRPSILQISVDTVRLVEVTSEGERVIDEYSYLSQEGHVVSGTAFLTTDSCIVTARHCIEPWLNDPAAEEAETPEELSSTPTRWAMEAETYNQMTESDTTLRVVAVCNFHRGPDASEHFGRSCLSSEFHTDRSRDYIMEKGNFERLYFWRSIKETYSNKEMMLGDLAWVRTDSLGSIPLASTADIKTALPSRQTLFFMGYPDHKTMHGLSVEDGKLEMDFVPGTMIAHNGNLIHGYSGAPTLVIMDSKVYAVGVVSRLDANGGGRTYSVPVSEMNRKEEGR